MMTADPAAQTDSWRDASAVGAASSGMGASLAAIAAAACCTPIISPLIVGVLGAAGAATAAGWKPYTGVLLIVSGVLLAVSFRLVYAHRVACPVDAPSLSRRWLPWMAKAVLWVGAAIWVAALLARVLLG